MTEPLYSKVLNKSLTDFKFDDREESITFVFGNESLTLSAVHQQDCCEVVYADFDAVQMYRNQLIREQKEEEEYGFNVIEIKPVEDTGIILGFSGSWYSYPVNILIPCYNQQNGYYSSNLILNIKYTNENEESVTLTTDISSNITDVIS